jgi:hypothetical protein
MSFIVQQCILQKSRSISLQFIYLEPRPVTCRTYDLPLQTLTTTLLHQGERKAFYDARCFSVS